LTRTGSGAGGYHFRFVADFCATILALIVCYIMTSLWIIAQPIVTTR